MFHNKGNNNNIYLMVLFNNCVRRNAILPTVPNARSLPITQIRSNQMFQNFIYNQI